MQGELHGGTTNRREGVHMGTRKFTSLEDLPLVLRVEDLMPVLSIGRNTAYELVRCGRIRSIRIGNQFRIPREAVIEFLTHTAA